LKAEVDVPRANADIRVSGTKIRFSGGQTIEALDGEFLLNKKW